VEVFYSRVWLITEKITTFITMQIDHLRGVPRDSYWMGNKEQFLRTLP
jgi:hypothetical protein